MVYDEVCDQRAENSPPRCAYASWPSCFLTARGLPNQGSFLKGVTLIQYYIAVEETYFGEGCRIDQNDLATALHPVAGAVLQLATKEPH
jgi:hypothetical protein